MTRLTRFFDRLSRNDAMRAARDAASSDELARVRRIYRDIYYI